VRRAFSFNETDEVMRSATLQDEGALCGVKVLDISRVLGGPLAAQVLGDHGADVIKIEPPRGDETREMGPPFSGDAASIYVNVNRNKRGISLDLSSQPGRDVLLRLLEKADVLIDNFKPGTMEKWGMGFDVLSRRFPRLIHASITGFGPDGPLGGAPGYDVMVQAWSGLISVNGTPDSGPVRLGVPLVDMAAGANIVIGILLALHARERRGQGQHIDVSLYDSAIALTHPHSANWFMSDKTPGLTGNENPNLSPYSLYHTRTSALFIAVGNDLQFVRMCEVIARPALTRDPRFATNGVRVINTAELRVCIEEAIADLDGAELAAALLSAQVPAGLVQTIPQALSHPHTIHREMVIELDGNRWAGIPVKLSDTPGKLRRGPPEFNEHVDEILREHGFDDAEILELRQRKVLGQPRIRQGHG
jgi:crotonobetainyl-CoA:carnitine CoA-transferase CaiB-like acyl-CoA transferase